MLATRFQRLHSKDVQINPVQIVDASLVVTESSGIDSENNSSENALSKSVNETQMQIQEGKVDMGKALDAGLVISDQYFSFGRHLDELHVTWAHLEKKRTRLQTNTKTLEDLCSQSLETASQAIHDAITTHQVTASHISRRRQPAQT
ncbi:hypothetical protein Tco_1579473 [Tanacetum coccineum]